MKLIKFKKNQLITLLDIFIIVAIMIFVKTYMNNTSGNFEKIEKNKVKYTFKTDKIKYEKDELVVFNLDVESKSKKDVELKVERNKVFNLIIEKDGKLIYKRDLLDSLTDRTKKIIIKRYGKKTFSYEWYGDSNTEAETEAGVYKATLYSLDFDIKLNAEFTIVD